MNRSIAPQIVTIENINTGFPKSDYNTYRIKSEEGVFKLEIVFPNAGYSLIPNKFIGIYAMDLLFSGTQDKDANSISDSLDVLGAFVFKGCDYYSSSITIYGLNENIDQILKIIKDSVDNCVYPLHEVNIFKNQKNNELKINLNKTNYLANRQINQMIMGIQHPYSLHLEESILDGLKSEDLNLFAKEYLHNPYFIFTGSEHIDVEKTLLNTGLVIQADARVTKSEVLPNGIELEEFIVKKGSTQNSIRFGKILPSRQNPDFFKISLLNLVLGGYFGSRLMKNIREEKGLTYGIHSSLTPFKEFCIFKISSECNNKLTEEVKQEVYNEITKLQTELIKDEELTTAKNYLLGAISRNFDGAFNISERFKSFLELDKDYEYYTKFFKSIKDISSEELRICANNYLDIKTLKYCVSGEM